MDEKKILEMLQDSAEHVEIPSSLEPEMMEVRLKRIQKANRMKKFRIFTSYGTAAAAVMILVGSLYMAARNNGGSEKSGTAMMQEEKSTATMEAMDSSSAKSIELYQTAASYEDIYSEFKNTSGSPKADQRQFVEGVGTLGVDVRQKESDQGGRSVSDGGYLYTVDGNKVKIVNTQGNLSKTDSEIVIENSQEGGDEVRGELLGLYVDDDILTVVSATSESQEESTGGNAAASNVVVNTYNISDRKNPEAIGRVFQEGSYLLSRKVGDYVYLFSEGSLNQEAITENDGDQSKWLPCVNAEPPAPGDIYMAHDNEHKWVLMSSISIKNPADAEISKLIFLDASGIYANDSAVYLYKNNYMEADSACVLKYSLENGQLNKMEESIVSGSIFDVSSIEE